MKVVFFRSPTDLRKWLEKYHRTAQDLWVGFHKKGSGKPSITWPESVDEALCFGWIDGIRKRLDEDRYIIRFCPRRPRSTWSVVNIKRARALVDQGRLRAAGMKAFQARKAKDTGTYSYERRRIRLPGRYEKRLRTNKTAWAFFEAQPPSYRKVASGWVVSAKKEDTRLKRLERLIEASALGRRL